MVTRAEIGDDRPSVFSIIPEFTVVHRPHGGWRAWHRVSPRLVIERDTWPELETACTAARIARTLRIAEARPAAESGS